MLKNITIQNINTNYYDSGEGEKTVLFLHGWAAPVEVYQSIFNFLEGKNYRVIAPETPGCGKTPEPPEGWTVDKYVNFVLDFCKEMGLKDVILMGHSFGVRLMIKLMSLHTDKIICKKAVIIDGAGIVPKRPLSYYWKVYTYKLCKKIVNTKIGGFFFMPLWEERRGNAGSADYNSASNVMKHTLSLVVNEDLKFLMSAIDADVLLIWGENDDATPVSDGYTMEKLMQKAGLAVVKGAGHYPFLDQPKVFFGIMDAVM